MTSQNEYAFDISVVVPFFNEEGSLLSLYEKLISALERTNKPFEIIFVDDGSTDNSNSIVSELAQKDSRIKVIVFKSNRGKSQGLHEGFKAAKGNIIITMDADLQDDPDEIPNFLKKIDEGFDLVSGWKKKRFDPLEKRLPSKLFNKATSLITGLRLHDFNCGYKAYRREILDEIKVYGELHRYIPALAYWQGYRVTEIPVQHHPRRFGHSKYGWQRYFKGFFDLFTVVLLTKYVRNPIYLFGLTGSIFLLAGLGILLFITGLQLKFGSIMGHRPLSYLGVLSILFGSQSISLGLLSEILTSISQKKGQRRVSIRNLSAHGQESKNIDLSIIIPVHNEKENLRILYDSLTLNLPKNEKSYEIVFVDDGSIDGSSEVLKDIFNGDQNVRLIQLRKRFGKASALQAGFDHSVGNTLVTMDADLQDRPEELERFISKIDDGYEVVLGHRIKVPLIRSLFSKTFNRIASLFSGTKISDINCGLKALRRSVIEDLNLYGELQRLFPIVVAKKGFRMAEIEVIHKERKYGKSKYGFARVPKAFLDLFSVILLTSFKRKPLHLFGSVGLIVGFAGFSINAYLGALKIFTGNVGGHYTLLLMGVMLMILGLQWFSSGILSELMNDFSERETG